MKSKQVVRDTYACPLGMHACRHACPTGTHPQACMPPSVNYEMRSMSARYASYWNAFLLHERVRKCGRITSATTVAEEFARIGQHEIS